MNRPMSLAWWLVPFAALAAVVAAGAAIPKAPIPWAVDVHGRELPLPLAHNEQGDFAIIAPDAATANWIYASAVAAGVPVEMPNAKTVTGKLLCPNHWLWWWDLRPQLTGCVVSGGAEARPASNSTSSLLRARRPRRRRAHSGNP